MSFFLPVLEYCSAVWCSADNTHLKLLDRVVSGDSFLTGGVLECDLAHHRSVTVLSLLCMLYNIRGNPMHPLCGTLPEPYVPVSITHGAVTAHPYTVCLLTVPQEFYSPSQYLCGTILETPY